MDDKAYLITTYIVSIAALIAFLLDVSGRLITKRSLEFKDYIIYVLFFAGMYLIVPCALYTIGKNQENMDLIEKAAALSINNYEKRLCYQILADYNYSEAKKDGKAAIEYYEKAIAGEYSKYAKSSRALAYLYLLRGDSERVIKIEQDISSKEILPFAYILKGEYKKALDVYPNKSDSEHLYLRSAILASLGRQQDAALYRIDATKAFNKELKEIPDKAQQVEFAKKIANYKSIAAFKTKLSRDKKEYNL